MKVKENVKLQFLIFFSLIQFFFLNKGELQYTGNQENLQIKVNRWAVVTEET